MPPLLLPPSTPIVLWHVRLLIEPCVLLQCFSISEALSFLHASEAPLLHRDLRCANVMLDSDNADDVKVRRSLLLVTYRSTVVHVCMTGMYLCQPSFADMYHMVNDNDMVVTGSLAGV